MHRICTLANRLKLAAPLVVVMMSTTPAFAQTICNAGDQIVVGYVELTGSCTINGSLTIQGGVVKANFAAAPTAVLRVHGNVSITGTGALWVEGGTFEIQQDYAQHRSILAADDATIVWKSTSVSLNQGSGVKSLIYNAHDRSKTFVVDSTLDTTHSWLISNQLEDSTLVGIRTQHVPTEIYVKGRSTVSIAEPTSYTGVWLEFASGTTGTLDLPVQTDGAGHWQAYSWRVGRGTSALAGVGWLLQIADARVGLGMESHSGSRIAVNGQGRPTFGEIKIGYHVSGGVQTLSGLSAGLQSDKILGGDQLTLRNVELGPIAWQIYAHDRATLTINSSVLNEIGAATGGNITVRDSIMQFGTIASLGSGAASIAIYNSQIHSQAIEAMRDGVVHIYDSPVFGATVIAHEALSAVNFHRGALLRNRSNACPLILDGFVDVSGVPICNPFLAPDAAVTKAGSGQISCDSTFDCHW